MYTNNSWCCLLYVTFFSLNYSFGCHGVLLNTKQSNGLPPNPTKNIELK